MNKRKKPNYRSTQNFDIYRINGMIQNLNTIYHDRARHGADYLTLNQIGLCLDCLNDLKKILKENPIMETSNV